MTRRRADYGVPASLTEYRENQPEEQDIHVGIIRPVRVFTRLLLFNQEG
jgi:hypothetical protein